MAAETPDRRINTDAPIRNDGEKRQPHERDESPDAQDTRPRGVIRQAQSDIEQGLVDTDARNTPGVETVADVHGDGQAAPQPDRQRGMRERTPTSPTTRGER
ncbi:MAG: hypothetical protein ACXU8N_21815 [Telluria sp.]